MVKVVARAVLAAVVLLLTAALQEFSVEVGRSVAGLVRVSDQCCTYIAKCSSPSLHGAEQGTPCAHSFLLRLEDRNMEQLKELTLAAAGLGAGAGKYLTPSQVRSAGFSLSGWADDSGARAVVSACMAWGKPYACALRLRSSRVGRRVKLTRSEARSKRLAGSSRKSGAVARIMLAHVSVVGECHISVRRSADDAAGGCGTMRPPASRRQPPPRCRVAVPRWGRPGKRGRPVQQRCTRRSRPPGLGRLLRPLRKAPPACQR